MVSKIKQLVLPLFVLVLLLFHSPSFSEDRHMKLLMDDITKMYMSSMVFIFKNQPLINSKGGDKSSLFGPTFIENVKKTYIEKYQQPFPKLDHETKQLLILAMMEVMEDNRQLINDDELGFKGIIPAVFAFQISAKLSIKGVGLRIKFTRTKDSIRNIQNSPDEWESAVMALVQIEPKVYYDDDATLNGKPAYRQFTPLPMAQYCLNCHGRAKDNPLNFNKDESKWTNIDMTGFEMENWLISDFGGGVSLSVEKANIDKVVD